MRPMVVRVARTALALLALCCAARAHGAGPEHKPAQRIVSLAPNLTELAFAAGAGDRLIGVVEYSDYPEAAQHIPRIGDAFRVDLERVLVMQPDLVLAWESGTPAPLIERLQALGLRVLTISTRRLADIPAALRTLGRAAGAPQEAERSAAAFEARIAQLRARYGHRSTLSVFVQVNERPIYTVTGEHIISEVLALCGGRNVFAELEQLAPIVGVESVLAANPDVILAASDAVPDAPAQWSRWAHLRAVRTGQIHTISSDALTRATPRLAAGAEQVCTALQAARAALQPKSAER